MLACAVLLACCGQVAQTPAPLPDAVSFIPIAPAPHPTATPTPVPLSEDPLPANPAPGTPDGGGGGSCGPPAPPPLADFGISFYSRQGDQVTLDSTPLVGPDQAYCREIGYTDGRSFCPVRGEGSPDRLACEAVIVGSAADTGRIGPTWSANGRPCNDSGASGSCANHPTNQFKVYVFGAATVRACARTGVCGEVTLQ